MKRKKTYQASTKYHVEYTKRNYKKIEILLNRETDADIIEYLEQRDEPVAVFIKKVLKEYMKGAVK